MGTIPIYWGESGNVNELLGGDGASHWARLELEKSYDLRPLDTLTPESLSGLKHLLLAQPRALSAAENVALDDWVRGGGRLLLFADPMLTGKSKFPIGDRRRPQDVVLLSPILKHWGLELQFDVERPEGFVLIQATDQPIPVNRPGSFVALGTPGPCTLAAEAVLASCSIGEGRVVLLADAAVLDLYDPHPQAAAALDWLAGTAWSERGK
ncbi:MAG: Gldg family protein [Porphyrobacter sp.]|nr:Gldg family protein [Porphyrobacter sp.]